MTKMKMNKAIAAMLSLTLLLTSMAPAALAEEIATPPEAAQEKQVAAPGAVIETDEDVVLIKIKGEEGLALYCDLSGDLRMDLRAGDEVLFEGLAGGEYELEVDYHDVQKGVSAYRTKIDVAGKPMQEEPPVVQEPEVEVVVPPAEEPEVEVIPPPAVQETEPEGQSDPIVEILPPPAEATDTNETQSGDAAQPESDAHADEESQTVAAPGASVSVNGNTVTVTISGEAGLELYVILGDDAREHLASGATQVFENLTAGEYELEVDYQIPQGVTAYKDTIKIKADEEGTPDGGENDENGGDSGTTDDNVTEIIPPAMGGDSTDDNVTEIIPPAMGGDSTDDSVTEIIPPAMGGDSTDDSVTEIIPPTTGGDSSGGSTTTPAAPTQFAMDLSQQDGVITAVITGASDRELSVKLIKDGQTLDTQAIIGNGSVSFAKQAAGVYTVYCEYVTPADGIWPGQKIIEIPAASSGGTTEPEKTPTVKQIEAEVKVGETSIEVKVTGADNWPMYVAVGNDAKIVNLGQTAVFSNLAAGNYEIEVDYVDPVQGVSPFRSVAQIVKAAAKAITFSATAGQNKIEAIVSDASTLPITVRVLLGSSEVARKDIAAGVGKVTFENLAAGVYTVAVNYNPAQSGVSEKTQGNVVVTGKVAGIAIKSVTAGENKITVSGTAQPSTDIAITTTPATSTTIVRSDSLGSFTAELTCPAGTYTQIRAVYVADNTVSATANGSYAVTAPAEKPSLAVDPIYTTSMKVIAKSEPGVKVNLRIKEYNYGQTRVAESDGLLKFSLPMTYKKGTVVTFTVYYGKDNALSYQQTVKIQKEPDYDLLKYGDTGSDVKKLTDRLEELGYLADDTTRYSSAVREAVKLFQELNGLDVDGIAGPLTQSALYSLAAIPYGKDAVYPTLVRGDRGMSLLYKLQQRLKDLGYYTLRVDGIFGSGTQRAVRDFQRVNGLTVTGSADNATQQLLYSSSAKPAGGSSDGDYDTLYRSKHYQSAVVPLQRRLKALGYLSGSVDGYFGSQTQRAVRSFQRRNGLSVTGVADEETQELLYSADAKAASGSSSSGGSSSGYRLLYWGCEGDAVKRLQSALLAAGYSQVRVADGIYGQWTYDGVRAFQKDRGLAVDGIAGKNTQNALYGTSY